MLRPLAVALALSALAGAALAQPDPYGLPPGYEPEAPQHVDDGYPQPKEYTDADYGEPNYGDDRDSGPEAYAEDGRAYAGGHYNSGASAERRRYSYSSESRSSYESSSRYEEDYAYAGEAEVYVAPFAYQRRAEAYYEANGYAEAGAWDRRDHYGYAARYRQDLADLHLDSSFFSGGQAGGVEGGPPVYVGGGGGGYVGASASASASAYASARGYAYARGGGKRRGGHGCGCR